MKRMTIFVSLLLIFLFGESHAAEKQNTLINLEVQKITSAARPDAPSFFIRSVTDIRTFGASTSNVQIPSWGGTDLREQTDADRRKAVARAFVTRKKLGGNVLILRGDVESVTKDVIVGALAKLGYSVIEKNEDVKPDTIILDVAVGKFWGYFQEAFVGGDISVTIETTITENKSGAIVKKTLEVSSKKSARYPNKPENWELVFSTALSDLMNASMGELRQ